MTSRFLHALLLFLFPFAILTGQADERIARYEREIETLNQSRSVEEARLGALHLMLAQLYSKDGRIGKARLNADLAKELFSEKYPEYLPVVENLRGSLALAAGDQFEALAAYNEGLNSFYWGAHRGLPRPHPDSIHGRQYEEATMLLGNRAALLANSNRPLEAFVDYELLFELQDERRKKLSPAEMDAYPGQNIRRHYDAAVNMLVTHAQSSGDPSLLWDAFIVSERGKAYSQLESLTPPAAAQSARLEMLSQRIDQLSDTGTDPLALEAAQLQYQRLLAPRVRNSYNEVPTSPGRNLPEYLRAANTSVVAYHVGKSASHAFVFDRSADTLAYFAIPAQDSLALLVGAFVETVSTDPARARPGRIAQIRRGGYQLYRRLFGAAGAPRGDLLILPDGPLRALPFASLMTQPGKLGKPLEGAPWLIKGRSLATANTSQTLVPDAVHEASTYAEFLTIYAPGAAAISEVVPVETPAKVYVGAEAGVEEFISQAGQSRIIDLRLGGEETRFSSTSFWQFGGSSTPGYPEQQLALYQLASLDLPADLILVNGYQHRPIKSGKPGNTDFALAIEATTAKASITPLWATTKPARSIFTKALHAELWKGQPGDDALAAAQRAVQANAKYADPFYWAGHRFYGKALPLVPGEEGGGGPPTWVLTALGGLGLLVGGSVLLQRSNGGRSAG